MSIFEIIMLICFGASWPFAIAKTIKAKDPRGKSFLFLTLLLIGYISGCIHKIVYTPQDKVLYLYVMNGLLVLCDLSLSLYYGRKLKKNL